MDAELVRAKFGDDYCVDEQTFVMGIDRRFTAHIAERFRGRRVLETCTGGGFTTIALAREAEQVVTVEIDPARQAQAVRNLERAGLLDRVTFVWGDVLDDQVCSGLPEVDAAFLDPDWAVTGPEHVHHFLDSTMRPPADALLERVFRATGNVALIMPPGLDVRELEGLPVHERQRLYLGESRELYCLYFGELASQEGETDFRV
ncbi:MAG: RsmD family RNA methyltransferase [Acidobacteria bacterium]|nr:RsmD family RNA methyltransferase [Acidobacteriota bacterium]